MLPWLYTVVFDVESVGLHGEGFAYGAVVLDKNGIVVETALNACHPLQARGTAEGRAWVKQNVPHIPSTRHLPESVRACFWDLWERWRVRGAVLAADVPWPVEANFLSDAVNDDFACRAGKGPYPLIDINTFVLARKGHVPDPDYKGLRRHHPLDDARASAQLLIDCFC